MSERQTFRNPVHDGYFGDPFVLRRDDAWYAYGTNTASLERRVFEVLRSTDFVTWTSLGPALDRLREPRATDWYWAPEVTEREGRFFMYYSVGVEDRGHVLRVAIAEAPGGPFTDAGVVLTPGERFAIDPHPFRDDDGQWYLFYARDVLEGPRVGTSVAVDRLVDPVTLAGEPRPVLVPSAEWQVFLRARPMYGAVYDWHTLEGPFVVRRHGRLWCLYSGGRWEGPDYGVSWAVADGVFGPWVDAPGPGPALLRSLPGRLVGPGHNSIVSGPDGEDWIAYHAWDPERTARRMCLDRVTWTVDGPRTDGPTADPRPIPVPVSSASTG